MDLLITVVTNASVITIATLFLKHFFNRNAQKQKGQLDKGLEEVKSDLLLHNSVEQEKLNKKREVYINLIDSMAVFIGNRIPTEQEAAYKQKFLQAYDTSWLWASDEVLKALSMYMKFKAETDNRASSAVELQQLNEQEKELFAKCILAIRKDIGFSETTVELEDYRFIYF
ncbi:MULTISPECIES: hypothetical protein [Bacillus cereus group]|uniref:hypothetical protein n=1 Tax=Bacillus cereus group TaxID=86661 RepID=UPI000BF2A9D8|nr:MULTISPECIES: hypothetical protein [Bacillus cereus group]PEV47419.1 hypothetical protein CN426_07840 [Bacillus thuringiensis]PGS52897.1 hypothetical protein COC66_21975 [Bacillus cereus]